mmetsp:Transcript_12283/g.30071  ORF Transcript_12283/g.30071 Transcript_12283/m.30071 type:complete len:422 (+) Transcript_12283:39-1304(+)
MDAAGAGSLPGWTPRMVELRQRLIAFIKEEVEPAQEEYDAHIANPAMRWTIPPVMEKLKASAKAKGLWNLFLPKEHHEGAGLSNAEYAHLAEIMGRCKIASEACNCSAPDTGNMEVLVKFGTPEQKARWLVPLLNGDIRSCFLMTEPAVASSDALNIQTEIRRDGDSYVITGRKWWSSGALDPRCKVAIVLGKTDKSAPKHQQHAMIIMPMDAPGVTVIRPMLVFGYDDAPSGHPEVDLKEVRVPLGNLVLGEGRGFEIAQARLGPGRIHHCMRAIGLAERAQEDLVHRALRRETFGKKLAQHGAIEQGIARNRMLIDQARLLVLHAASLIDQKGAGSPDTRKLIAMIKVAAPQAACAVIDSAIQVHGGAGLSQDFGLAESYAGARALRIVDGPDEVHLRSIARDEMRPFVKEMLKERAKL